MAGYIGGKVAVSAPQQIETKHTITATASQTSIPNISYTVGAVHVFQNGIRLVDGTDYTATNGSTVTLETGATEGDQIVIVSHGSFETSDTVSKASGGTFSSNVTVSGSVTANSLIVPDGSIPLVDLDIDGGTDIGAALVDADLMIVDDGAGGTNRKATMSRLATYMGTKIGGGMEFISSSGAISNAASVAFTGFDASKYDHYQFMLQHVIPATDGVVLFAQSSTDGGSSYASTSGDYHTNTTNDMIGFTVAGHTTISGETLLVGSGTNEHGVSGPFMLYAPHNTSAYTYANCGSITFNTNAGAGNVSSNGTSANSFSVASSVRLAAEDVDAIKFIFSSGNIESGEITMFGIVNS
jgi:hypothetical protein